MSKPPSKRSMSPENTSEKTLRLHDAGNAINMSEKREGGELNLGEPLLDRARMQWQFAEWGGLVALGEDDIRDHPDRAKLALLIGAGWQQLDGHEQAAHFVKRALAWGCSRTLVARLLVAGVHNTLARASAVADQEDRALKHFQASVDGVGGDKRLACQARSVREVVRLGLLGDASNWIGDEDGVSHNGRDESYSPALARRLFTTGASRRISQLVQACLAVDDVHAAINHHAQALDGPDRFRFYCGLSSQFHERGDKLTAQHFLACAREIVDVGGEGARATLAKKYVQMGQVQESASMLLEQSFDAAGLTANERGVIAKAALGDGRPGGAHEHGHALLIDALKRSLPAIRANLGAKRDLVLIEIGSTREDVPGQGSTRKLAEFCAAENLRFITVDMDPQNTTMAQRLFDKLKVPFQAITDKGEDFLRSYEGAMDFVFLDAYDFDHGKHSELRQSRYRKFLGSEIDEQACHRMHLECAESIVKKLSSFGLVCVDDTWQENDAWTAKGTLAVPYLLERSFELVEARNKAALLKRT